MSAISFMRWWSTRRGQVIGWPFSKQLQCAVRTPGERGLFSLPNNSAACTRSLWIALGHYAEVYRRGLTGSAVRIATRG